MKGYSIFLIYTIAVTATSILFEQTRSTFWVIVIALLYLLAIMIRKRFYGLEVVQLSLLVTLHFVSGNSYCLPLYLYHMCCIQYKITNVKHTLIVNSSLMVMFFAVAMTYLKPTLENVVDIFFITSSTLALAYFFGSIIRDMEQQKQLLTHEKRHLATHDSLTGLYNFQELHRQMEILVEQKKPIILVLADCKDLKSKNTTTGFQGVNDILKQVAQLLSIMFPDSSLISRYGGDEFAIVMEYTNAQQTINTVKQLLATEFPKLTGIEINYGMACFPQDGLNKNDLTTAAENNLYRMKRDSWLKREDHMLRSEKLRVVGELASGMAHEIRNPLTTVKGFLQLSKAGNYNIEPWYDLIMDEITRMSMLTAEFLQFSKPHVTQFRVQSLQSCVKRVISLLDSEASRLGHQIFFDHDDHEIRMLMDQDKMLQLLLNLLKNALEAMEEQGVIRIRLEQENTKAIIQISDTGKGIPENELDKIFIPFYTTKDSGTGLGLSICHKIVQDHEGTIEVESLIGKGTKFIITLPSLPDEAGTSAFSA